jgi:hypothetical protein
MKDDTAITTETWVGKKKWGYKNGSLEQSELNLPEGVCFDETGFISTFI